MNYSIIRYILGWIFNFQAAFMLVPAVTALIYREKEGWSFIITMIICSIIGLLMTSKPAKDKVFFTREGFATTALSWVVLCITGAIPFVISGAIPNPVDAIFETVSGFTTTGASIVPLVEDLPYCMNMWRCFTHWVGGMGVLVFILALLPMTGGSHMNLMKAESPGPVVGKLVPRVRSTAKILYLIYLGMTLIQLVLLLAGGMSVFDSICTALGTAGTGGFGIKNDSFAGYSSYLQIVTTIFMILFGVNFNFYYFLLFKKAKQAFKLEEVRWYIGIIVASIVIITFYISGQYSSIGESIRHAAFQVGSIITTTGFATTDFNLWHSVPKAILVLLMFIGACAGSTGGGFKVSRVIILWKAFLREMKRFLHPRTVKKVQMDEHNVEEDTIRVVCIYTAAYLMIFIVSVLLISFEGKDLVTNFTAIAATFNNIGPGLEMVGPTSNFAHYTNFSKLIMSFDMLAGRLELFPVLLLFSRDTWRKF